jgi:hypothetical protein
MNFSASDLVKKSAAQIKYLRDKAISIHTWKMENGIEYEHKIAEENKGSCEEMRTAYSNNDITIFACHDIVCDDKIIEVKTTEFGDEQWYFESSLVQVAFYKSLLMTSNGDLYTPKFRTKEGYNRDYKKVNPNIDYHLMFGDKEYKIDVLNPDKIIEYFLDKAKITMLEYDDCRNYDKQHKWQHYNELCKYFNYEKV